MTAFGAPTVFVVDDDDAVRDSTAFLLRAAGFPVEMYATTGAFLQAAHGRAGCAVMDLRMPVIDGLEAARRLAAGTVSPALILVTGDTELPESSSQVFEILPKPLDDELLIDCVTRALAARPR